MRNIVVAMTGASGAIYGVRLIEELLKTAEAVHLCLSSQALPIISSEAGAAWQGKNVKETEKKIRTFFSSKKVYFHDEQNLAAPVSSGSFQTDGMFVVPCSMKTLSAIASGYAHNLICRAADVTIKEGRKLILSPREMPFNAIHLENMLQLARMGVHIAPPVPAFYQNPRSLKDLADFVVGKILDCAGIEHELFQRWA